MSPNSTQKVRQAKEKPSKPRPDFPLFPHLSGKWAKTIRGKTFYFGRWDSPEAALAEYLDVRDDLFAGRTPTGRSNGLSIAELCNAFLRHCRAKADAGEMAERTYKDYEVTTDRIVAIFGKRQTVEGLRPDDFAKLRAEIVKGRAPVSVGNCITRTRVVFNFALKNGLVQTPVQYGVAFQRPTKKTLRQEKANRPRRFFDDNECRKLLENSRTPELKAMILLGLNCGFGNSDCAKLPLDAVDLAKGWIHYPRPKTGIDRRCPLWRETVAALEAVLERRERRAALYTAQYGREPITVFLTRYGRDFANDETTVTNEFVKTLDKLGMKRPGRGFYALRHTFRTIADGSRDFPACRVIMGHVDDSMDNVYTDSIDDDRLRAVVEHVRQWLFPPKKKKKSVRMGRKR